MSKLVDVTGMKFGRLTVISRGENDAAGQARWNCQCECGNTTLVRGFQLRSGQIKSCGCLSVEKFLDRVKTHGLSKDENGKPTRLYKLYQGMKHRCYNPNDKEYKRYGNQGITVCDEWIHNFQAFYDWAMANGYRDDLTIDRIDNSMGYSPDNCRWATLQEQAVNRRNVIKLTMNGETKTLKEWSQIVNIDPATLRWRHLQGWSDEETLGRRKYEKY